MSTAIDLADHVSESDLQRIGPESAIAVLHEYDDDADRIMWNVVADDRTLTQFDDDRGDEAQQVTAALVDLRDKLAARRDLIGGIRDLADLLEQHPELPAVHVLAYSTHEIGADDFRAVVEMLRPLGEEVGGDDLFGRETLAIRRQLAPDVALKYEIEASKVCEMREVPTLKPVLPDWVRNEPAPALEEKIAHAIPGWVPDEPAPVTGEQTAQAA